MLILNRYISITGKCILLILVINFIVVGCTQHSVSNDSIVTDTIETIQEDKYTNGNNSNITTDTQSPTLQKEEKDEKDIPYNNVLNSTVKNLLQPLSDDDFIIEYKIKLSLESNIEELDKKMGDWKSATSNTDGYGGVSMSKKYEFYKRGYYAEEVPIMIITIRKDLTTKKTEIANIELHNISTKRGLNIGDTYQKMLELYGEPTNIKQEINNIFEYDYVLGYKKINIGYSQKNDKIIGINIKRTNE